MTTQEKNEVIHRWMGWKQSDGNDEVYHKGQWYNDEAEHLPVGSELKYDKLWDGWLMPVVEKIDKLHDKEFSYEAKNIALGDWPKDDKYMNVIAIPLATPIAEAHEAVFNFIEWYKANVKQS